MAERKMKGFEIMNLQVTIERLKQVILDPNCEKMNKSTVVGFLGEIMVFEKLKSEGLEIFHKGNQAGYDLEVENGPTIDVKACTPRDEFGNDKGFWGWALLSASKKRALSFSHIVCVAFSRTLDVHCFYVIKADVLQQFPPSIKRYSKVLRCYNIFDSVDSIPKNRKYWEPVRLGCLTAKENGYVAAVKPNESLRQKLNF
jgi:hypothetical protein